TASASRLPGYWRHSTSLAGSMPFFARTIAKKCLRRARLIANRDGFAAQRFEAIDVRSLGAEKPDAAAMHAGDDLDIEPLFQVLQPTQRQPQTGIGLAGCNRLQQLIGRAPEIDKLDIEVVLGEDTPLLRDRRSYRAGRVGVPGKLKLTRC